VVKYLADGCKVGDVARSVVRDDLPKQLTFGCEDPGSRIAGVAESICVPWCKGPGVIGSIGFIIEYGWVGR